MPIPTSLSERVNLLGNGTQFNMITVAFQDHDFGRRTKALHDLLFGAPLNNESWQFYSIAPET